MTLPRKQEIPGAEPSLRIYFFDHKYLLLSYGCFLYISMYLYLNRRLVPITQSLLRLLWGLGRFV